MNGNRRLLLAVLGVFFFSIIVIVWYFFYAKPIIAPSLGETNNPVGTYTLPPRLQFLTWGQDDTGTSTTEVTDPLKEPLVQVWNKPAVGQTFITQEILKEVVATTSVGTSTIEVKKMVRATSTVLIFIDKVTGYVYGYPLETGEIYQITNTVIPSVYDAHFFNNGRQMIVRSVDTEREVSSALIATLPSVPQGGSALSLINTITLPSRVASIAVNGRQDRASYVVNTDNGSAVYTTTANGVALVASSPFGEWVLSYGGEALYATSKASAYVGGITTKLPSFSIEVDSKTGLVSNPGKTGDILNSMWSSSGLLMFITTLEGNLVLSTKTLASKCAWGERDLLVCAVPRSLPRAIEGLPDDWYQGRVFFTDDLYLINKNSGSESLLYDFDNKIGTFDVDSITVSLSNDLFSFTRKQNGTLWLLNTSLIVD